MKRRQFFKVMGAGLVGLVASLFPTQGAEPVILGVDVAAPGPDTSLLSYWQGPATNQNVQGGYLVPQEYQDELLKRLAENNNPIVVSARWVDQTPEQKNAREAFFKYLKEQSGPSEKGMYYDLQSAHSIADRCSEWPGIRATWQET